LCLWIIKYSYKKKKSHTTDYCIWGERTSAAHLGSIEDVDSGDESFVLAVKPDEHVQTPRSSEWELYDFHIFCSFVMEFWSWYYV
jgi:hypothetical protein